MRLRTVLAARKTNIPLVYQKSSKNQTYFDMILQKNNTNLNQLFDIIEQRKTEMPPDSYTTSLFLGGMEQICAKFEEESQELIDATKTIQSDSTKKQVIHEAADLMYHFFVLLASCDLTLCDVENELSRRFGISGLIEKSARNTQQP